MEKKEKSMWFLATTHFLTASFVMPLLSAAVFYGALYFLFPSFHEPLHNIWVYIGGQCMGILGMVYGVYYSRDYLQKKYVISNARELVRRATIFAVVFSALMFSIDLLPLFISWETFVEQTGGIAWFATFILSTVAGVVIFYIVSKRAFGVR